MTIPQALDVKEELEKIDELLKQLERRRARRRSASSTWSNCPSSPTRATSKSSTPCNSRCRIICATWPSSRVGTLAARLPAHAQSLPALSGKLLERIFSELAPSRTGRHQGPIVGEGAVELQHTKPYEFGDSVTQMDIPATLTNAMIRGGASAAHPPASGRHRNPSHAEHAQVRHRGADGHERLDALRRPVRERQADGTGLDGLIRSEFPGDFLQFIEMYTFAKPRHTERDRSPVAQVRVDLRTPWCGVAST